MPEQQEKTDTAQDAWLRRLSCKLSAGQLCALGLDAPSLQMLLRHGPAGLGKAARARLETLGQLFDDDDEARVHDALIAMCQRAPSGFGALRMMVQLSAPLLGLGWTPEFLRSLALKQIMQAPVQEPNRSVARMALWWRAAIRLGLSAADVQLVEQTDASILDAMAQKPRLLRRLLRGVKGPRWTREAMQRLLYLGQASNIQRFLLCGELLQSMGLTLQCTIDLAAADQDGRHTAFVLDHLEHFFSRPERVQEYLAQDFDDAPEQMPLRKRKQSDAGLFSDLMAAWAHKRPTTEIPTAGSSRSKFEAIEQQLAALPTMVLLRLGIPAAYILGRAGLTSYPKHGYLAAAPLLQNFEQCGLDVQDVVQMAWHEGSEHLIECVYHFVRTYEPQCQPTNPTEPKRRSKNDADGDATPRARSPSTQAYEHEKAQMHRWVVEQALAIVAQIPQPSSAQASYLQHPVHFGTILSFVIKRRLSLSQVRKIFVGGDLLRAPVRLLKALVDDHVELELASDIDSPKTPHAADCAHGSYELLRMYGARGLALRHSYFVPLLTLGAQQEDVLEVFCQAPSTDALDDLLLAILTHRMAPKDIVAFFEQSPSDYDDLNRGAHEQLGRWQLDGVKLPVHLQHNPLFFEVAGSFDLTSEQIDALAGADDPMLALQTLLDLLEDASDLDLSPGELVQLVCCQEGRDDLEDIFAE